MRILPVPIQLWCVATLTAACASTGALPPQAVTHNRVGADRLESGQLDDAESRFRLALEFHPGFAEPHANLGLVMLQRGRLAEAEDFFRAAIRLDQDFDEAWSNLGVVLLRRSRVEEATRAFEEALAIDPGHVPARRNLADVWMMRRDYSQARAQLLRLVQLVGPEMEAEWARANGMLAYCELRLGRPSAARDRAAKVLAQTPEEPIALTVRGILAIEADRLSAARRDLEAASTDRVVGWDARLRLAALDVATGQHQAARRRLVLLLREQRNAPAVHLLAAHLALAENDLPRAQRHARRAVALAPDLVAAREVLEQACPEGCD